MGRAVTAERTGIRTRRSGSLLASLGCPGVNVGTGDLIHIRPYSHAPERYFERILGGHVGPEGRTPIP